MYVQDKDNVSYLKIDLHDLNFISLLFIILEFYFILQLYLSTTEKKKIRHIILGCSYSHSESSRGEREEWKEMMQWKRINDTGHLLIGTRLHYFCSLLNGLVGIAFLWRYILKTTTQLQKKLYEGITPPVIQSLPNMESIRVSPFHGLVRLYTSQSTPEHSRAQTIAAGLLEQDLPIII